MNRIIKFRIWSADYKKYLEDMQYPNGHSVLWIFATDGTPYHIETSFEGLEATPLNLKIGEVVIEQFTGLTDKNGTEIYEGDIMREWLVDEVEDEGGVWWIVEVKFLAGAWRVCQIGHKYNRDNHAELLHDVIEEDSLEIIGNIHEHPELICT